MTDLVLRVQRVEDTRRQVLDFLEPVSEAEATFAPSASAWSLQQIAEHLSLAEEVGILFIWRATITPWTGEHPHRGLTIEEVVARTWKDKEIAPEPATPRFGGPLAYWSARLAGCARLLQDLAVCLEDRSLERVIYPHVLSGPLDAGQRIDFLAFHMARHLTQMRVVREHPQFPA